MGAALFAGSDARLSELLALRIEQHIHGQLRTKKVHIIKLTLKTDAAYRDIDLCSALARMLDDKCLRLWKVIFALIDYVQQCGPECRVIFAWFFRQPRFAQDLPPAQVCSALVL
jgi:hypothetical protein